jgi:hypothetical protein
MKAARIYRFPTTMCLVIAISAACANDNEITPSETLATATSGVTESPSRTAATDGKGDRPLTTSPTAGKTSSEPADEDSTETLLLGQQIVVTGTGGGASGSCWEAAASRFARQERAAWLVSFDAERQLAIPLAGEVGVCLKGFTSGDPVMLRVATAERTWEATVRVSDKVSDGDLGVPEFLDVPPGVLPTATPITAVRQPVGDEVLHSTGIWLFLPPAEVRDHLTLVGEVVVTAEQGAKIAAEVRQPIDVLGPRFGWVDARKEAIFVSGFPAGSRIPVGIYEGRPPDGLDSIVEFVRKIGVIDIPRSRVAEFALPADVLALRDDVDQYCVAVATVQDCLFLD